MQAMVMWYISRTIPINSGVYRRVILPYIEGFWRKALGTQRFRFRAPSAVIESFMDAVSKPSEERAAAILRTVLVGLRVSVPPEAGQAREWLWGAGTHR
jgi:hypothetical protein